MRRICTLLSLGTLAFSVSAFAQGAGVDKPKAEPKPAAPAAPAAPAVKAPEKPTGGEMGMMMPKPAPELDQMKDMIGVWSCDGKFAMGGKEMKSKSKASFNWDLDKFFIAGTMSSPKSKENPNGYKGKVIYGYDAGSKMFTQMSADNMGGMGMATSKGYEGDSMTWTGKGKMMGMEMDTKETITRKGPREVHISGSMGSGAGASTWEMDCKK